MRKNSKRWLMSMMKTSGSKRRYVGNASYADERQGRHHQKLEELPTIESIKSSSKFYNGKINYGLLVRFLHTQVGLDWDDVYSRIMARIPTKLLDYKEMVFWFVANEVEISDGRLWDKKKRRFIWTQRLQEICSAQEFTNCIYYEFYVSPITNVLHHVQRRSHNN